MFGFDISPAAFVFAYAGFSLVKFLGYSFAGKALSNAFDEPHLSPWKTGFARTAIGIFGGILFTFVFMALCPEPKDDWTPRLIWMGGLFLFRIAEWWAVLWMFYPNAFREPKRAWVSTILCSLWSHFLDAPAWFVFREALIRLPFAAI